MLLAMLAALPPRHTARAHHTLLLLIDAPDAVSLMLLDCLFIIAGRCRCRHFHIFYAAFSRYCHAVFFFFAFFTFCYYAI